MPPGPAFAPLWEVFARRMWRYTVFLPPCWKEIVPVFRRLGVFRGLEGIRALGCTLCWGTENSLLKSVWPYPRTSPNFARPGENLIDWGPWIDSARIFAQLFPSFKSGRLEVLVRACGLQEELDRSANLYCPEGRRCYHAALYDALAGAQLLLFLAGDERLAALSVMQLMALSVLNANKRDSLLQDELF